MKGKFFWMGIAFILVLTSCASAATEEKEALTEAEEEIIPEEIPLVKKEEYEIKVTSDGVKYIVEPGKLAGGGPPKDGIPSLDNPKFVPLEEADRWIEDNELVLAIDYKGVKRVYPLQILVWHEIVNDVIAGDPLLITY